MLLALKSLKLEKLPTTPGVYFFLGSRGEVLYIGKAANLRARLASYLTGASQNEKMVRLVREATQLKVHQTDSEISALLQEAAFIKKIQPKYNILLRDDKNYFFVGFTKEKFPKIFITHQPIKGQRSKVKGQKYEFLGPFVSGRALKNTLKLLRRYFPYCTCSKLHHRECLSMQIGSCPGYCCQIARQPTSQEIQDYRGNIRKIRAILMGQGRALAIRLAKQIKERSRQLDFESAAQLKRDLESIEKIFLHRGLIETLPFTAAKESDSRTGLILSQILGIEVIDRIEMYDVSMIGGKSAVGAMVTFINGKPERGSWRLFKIKKARATNDPAMIAEVINRRLEHQEWQYPDIILVDGGRGQLAAANRVLLKKGLEIPIAAIAKGKDRKHDTLIFGSPLRQVSFRYLPEELRLFLIQIRDETHGFVLRYHRRHRRSAFIPILKTH